MLYFYSRLKNTMFWRDHIEGTDWINFLRRIKHGLEKAIRRTKMRMAGKTGIPNLVEILQSEFLTEKEAQKRFGSAGDAAARNGSGGDPVIDVIVPIYNGYDYLVKLFPGLLRTKMRTHIILVDDKSPDPRVLALEEEFANAHDHVTLIKQPENGGFVRSVNTGLALAKGHVALINTDTELPFGWCERLMEPILSGEKIGSVTPFSNSATIFSFPNFGVNNTIYRGLTEDKLDGYFQRIRPRYTTAPTGVGFCMGMSREAIDVVGILDEATFGRGFGEENDWCQRAAKAGFANVHAENLFVYHKHGGSFVSEEKEKLIADHLEKLKEMHPYYEWEVISHIKKDPNRDLRDVVQMIIDSHETHSVLYLDHSLGGGATSYLHTMEEAWLTRPCAHFTVRYSLEHNNYQLFYRNEIETEAKFDKDYSPYRVYEFDRFEDLLVLGEHLHFDEIYVNELVTYPRLWETQAVILELAQRQQAKTVMLMHDYFAVCPTINLMNDRWEYCGMPAGGETCAACFKARGFAGQYDCPDRVTWLCRWKEFLVQLSEVRCFSEDTAYRTEEAFREILPEKGALPLTVVPHTVDYLPEIDKQTYASDTVTIGLLGVLATHKGSDFIGQLIREIESRRANVRICLIGEEENVNFGGHACFTKTGRYRPEMLPRLIYENDIDLFFICSVWPETFSYTAEEIIRMGVPLACFPLGAPAERVARYAKGRVLTEKQIGRVLDELLEFAGQMRTACMPARDKKFVYLAEYVSFSSRYRLEHTLEEMLCLGVCGELWDVKHLPKRIAWETMDALVLYRCRMQNSVKKIVEEAKRHGVPVIYDVDDLVFDYDAICDKPYVNTKEYTQTYTELIHDCMKASDKLLVSTEHLRQACEERFPGKPIYVNRNAASSEMLILSLRALQAKKMQKDRFVIGYFSGSPTHNRDFATIADVLLEFLKTHPDAVLRIVGVMDLPESYRCVSDQISRVGFVDWRRLPEAIADVDVNLMPLEQTFFHECKSENKWMEAALVKTPTIGTRTEEIAAVTRPVTFFDEYLEVKKDDDIFLCGTAKEWEIGLAWLYAHPEEAARLAENAFIHCVNEKTTLQKHTALYDFMMN